MDAGRLRPQDAERILKYQEKKGIPFGQAGRKLRLISEEDVQFALARQFDHPYVMPDRSRLSDELVAAFVPGTPAVENLRAVRNQLMLRWFNVMNDSRPLAVVSPNRGDGRSWVAANLAVLFAQLGEPTLLIDGDLRHPKQHRMFGVGNRVGLSAILAGRDAEGAVQQIPELRELSVLTSGPMAPNPPELLTRSTFESFLADMRRQFKIILFDTPAAADFADAPMLAVRAGAALVVACDRRSRINDLERLADDLRDAGAQIVGSLIRVDCR